MQKKNKIIIVIGKLEFFQHLVLLSKPHNSAGGDGIWHGLPIWYWCVPELPKMAVQKQRVFCNWSACRVNIILICSKNWLIHLRLLSVRRRSKFFLYIPSKPSSCLDCSTFANISFRYDPVSYDAPEWVIYVIQNPSRFWVWTLRYDFLSNEIRWWSSFSILGDPRGWNY